MEGGGGPSKNLLMAVMQGSSSVAKSRSMVSLSSNSDPLNQSFTAIAADQARTR